MFDVVRRTAEACFMPLTVGGGVRTVDDIRKLLTSGADKVSINTAAVARREFVKEAAEKFGDQCIVVAIDAKKVSQPGEKDRWEIFTHGGRKPTGIDAVRICQGGGGARRRRNPADLDGPRRHQVRLRHRAHPRGVGRGAGAGDRLGRRRQRSIIWSRASATAMPPRCWRRRSSISASTRCARPRRTWPRPACRCGSILSASRLSWPTPAPLQPVVAPEQFAVRRDEGRRAEHAEPLRLLGLARAGAPCCRPPARQRAPLRHRR